MTEYGHEKHYPHFGHHRPDNCLRRIMQRPAGEGGEEPRAQNRAPICIQSGLQARTGHCRHLFHQRQRSKAYDYRQQRERPVCRPGTLPA